jgi:hypothetical protein
MPTAAEIISGAKLAPGTLPSRYRGVRPASAVVAQVGPLRALQVELESTMSQLAVVERGSDAADSLLQQMYMLLEQAVSLANQGQPSNVAESAWSQFIDTVNASATAVSEYEASVVRSRLLLYGGVGVAVIAVGVGVWFWVRRK